MCADVVLYSRLMGIDEEGTEYRGRTLRAVGDALPVEFNSVADAVRKRNARADGRDYVIERRAADHSANMGSSWDLAFCDAHQTSSLVSNSSM